MNLEQLDEDGYLHHINRCIFECPDSILSSLLVTSLQSVYLGKLTSKTILSVEASSDKICELAIKANAVLQKHEECSLNLVASIAYLKALIHAFVATLEKNEMCAATLPIITKRINALMETSAHETDLEAHRTHCLQVYFLKCVSSIKEGFELKKALLDLEDSLPVLQSINENDAFMTRSVTYDPLFMYRTIDDEYFGNALLSMHKPDEKKLKEIADHASTNTQEMFSFVGFIASTFYLKSQQKEMNDTKKTISECIVDIIQTKLSKITIKYRVFEMLLKSTDFAHPMLKINSETRSPDIQIVSVLIHLLCLIIFKGEAGNCWYDILTNLEKINSIHIPGNIGKQLQQTCVDHAKLYDHCKIRFASTNSKCPKCCKKLESNKPCRKEKEMRKKGYEKPSDNVLTSSEILQPIACHLMQFFSQGCILLSYAIKTVDADQVKSLLCFEGKPEEFLSDVLQNKWNNLKYLSQMNNEDLCTFIHVVIHDMETAFTSNTTPYHCSTVKDCEQVENDFQLSLQSKLLRKYKCIQNARRSLYERLGMDQHSLECEIQEVCMTELCVTDEGHNMDHQLSKLFCMTSHESKEGFIAQVFQGNNRMKYPLLSLILSNEDILTLPKFILPIMQWHRSTVSIGSYKIKKVECKAKTIQTLLNMVNDDKAKALFVKQFHEFQTNWNDLLSSPTAVFQSLLKQEHPLSKKDNISNCIISDESSMIHKVLMKLVEIHNYFIDSCLQIAAASSVQSLYFLKTGENLSLVKSTSLWELTEKDIIKYSFLDENMLQYSQCKLEFGEGQDRLYNLQKIENELAHDLILGKPYISVPSTFPHISFLDEFQNTFQLLNIIRQTIPQESLPQNILNGILDNKEENSRQIVELMTVLGMSLSLLKKTKGEPSLSLTEYLDNWKDIAVFPKGYRRLLPEPEDAIKLCHVVNLYVKLEEINGESVLDSLELKYRENIPREGEEKIKTTEKSYVCHLEVLIEALKIFIHRCLAEQNNLVSLDQELVDYIQEEQFWPHENLKDGFVCVGGERKNLTDIISYSICVKHIYKTMKCIQDIIKKMQEFGSTGNAAKSNTMSDAKKKNRRKFGKT